MACVCLSVHQGPAGIRGARGEKVTTTNAFSIFLCHHASCVPWAFCSCKVLNSIVTPEWNILLSIFFLFLSGRLGAARRQRRQGVFILISNKLRRSLALCLPLVCLFMFVNDSDREMEKEGSETYLCQQWLFWKSSFMRFALLWAGGIYEYTQC